MSVAVLNCHSALGGPSAAKLCLSPKMCVLVFKASIFDSLGVPSAKVCSSAKCCVLVFKASMLNLCGGSICHSVFICQVLHKGVKGIYALFVGVHLPKCVHLPSAVYWCSWHLWSISGGSICQSVIICQVLCCYVRTVLTCA